MHGDHCHDQCGARSGSPQLFMSKHSGGSNLQLLQDTLWELETPEEAELGLETLEQSLLPWLNFVKHETMHLLLCLKGRFLVYFFLR